MRVVHIIPGLEKEDGGPFYTLPHLWSGLGALGVDVRACATTPSSSPGTRPEFPAGYVLKQFPISFPRLIKYSPALGQALATEILNADLCHNHGCWLYPNWIAGSNARRLRKPLIISPLGHLDEWSLQRHAWRKRWVRLLWEEANWRYARVFVAKSEMEAAQLKQLGIEKNKISVVPNGLDPREWALDETADLFLEKHPELHGRRLLLFLSRIHPKKGLHHLLEAWRQVAEKFPDWHLLVVGEIGSPYGREMVRNCSSEPLLKRRMTFAGELQGAFKRSAMAASSLFVLPSESENFGQAVLEALASGLPVVTTRGCPWAGLEKHACGWWIEPGVSPLRDSLATALQHSSSELREMGARGRGWVLKEFDWATIAEQMRALYQKVLRS